MNLVLEKIPLPSPAQLASLVQSSPPACWFDSADHAHPRSRYSMIVLEPLATLAINSEAEGRLALKSEEFFERIIDDPETLLESWLTTFRDDSNPAPFFSGGIVGFLSYESYARRFGLKTSRRVPDFPDAYWWLVDSGFIIDHRQNQAWVFSRGIASDLSHSDSTLAQSRCLMLRQKLQSSKLQVPFSLSIGPIRADMGRAQYFEKMEKIHAALQRGDCYQVNFAQSFQAAGHSNAASLYLKLRELSPAPQMLFWNHQDFQILSASPETLLEVEGGKIRSFPIKGTAARLTDPAEDKAQQQKLLSSPKDAAELLMIVDMVRNDLGQVCKTGSVRVKSLKNIESFAHLHHLVAEVAGELKEGISPLQALQALSPGASISGTPKRKAIEMIDQLEESPRGIYTGSVGYVGFEGRSCFNIAIRTLFLRKDRLHYSAGGGIVVDSDPGREYEESLLKAKAFFQILS